MQTRRTALLASLGLLTLLGTPAVRADLALDPGFGTGGLALLDIGPGPDVARDIAVQGDGALVLAGRSRTTVGAVTNDLVALARFDGTTGAVDNTFGTAGVVTFLPGLTATNGAGGEGRAVVIQPVDQKILVAGTWRADPGEGSQVFVARFDTSGVLDPSFGTGGVSLVTPAGVTDPTGNAMALRSDGSIVVVGPGTAGDASVGFVIVLTSAGAVDPGFAQAVVANPLPAIDGVDFELNAVVVLPGDGVLAAGGGGDLTLAQFTSSGAPDTGFSGDGIASFNYQAFTAATGPKQTTDVATALALVGDGRILLAGRSADVPGSQTDEATLLRVTAGGALDTTFGSGGFAPLPATSANEAPQGVGVRPSGDIVLVGQGFAPLQVSPDGIAVSQFAGSLSNTLTSLVVLAGGDVAASALAPLTQGNSAFAAVRLDATDLPDGPDTVPNPFSFAAQTGLELDASATSAAVTITGIAPATFSPVAITNGEYSVGCTPTFTANPGQISNDQTVCIRADASGLGSTAVNALLDIGGVQGVFTLVTGDATPDPFTFVDQTGVAASTEVTSAPITLAGLTISTDVAVSGGVYSAGCTGTFTGQVTRVAPGTQICVRHTSSASPGGVVETTLTVGAGTEVDGKFSSTTAGDITPNAFSFSPQTDVAKSTIVQSNTITLTGFSSDSPVTVTGGEYSIGCTATFTALAGTVAPNATVCLRQTSSSAGGTATTATLTVGAGSGLVGVKGNFTVTTAGVPDTTPDAFSFPDQTNVPLGTVITSGAVTIGGYDTTAPVSVAGGTYSVGCGTSFTANAGTLAPGSVVCVRQTSAVTGGAVTSTTLTVGGVSDTFTSTTLPGDAVPEPFSFTDQTGVELLATITSAPVTITGIDIASPISVTGGQYSLGCTSTFTSAPANVTNGQTVCVRQTSSFDSNTSVSTTLTISTVSATFKSTTKTADQTPDPFSFTTQANAALDSEITSNTITVTGVDAPVSVSASGPVDGFNQPLYGFSLGCTGSFSQNGTVVNAGDTLCIVAQSAKTDSTSIVVTLTIGGSSPGTQTSATYTVTTGETVPDAFTFTDQVGVQLKSTVYAEPITITGITAPSRVEITPNGQYQLNCSGPYTRLPGLVSNNDTICIRQFAAGSVATLTDTVLTVGGVSDTFTTTTVAEGSVPGGSAMDVWALGLLAPLVVYRRRRSVCRSAFRRDLSL